MSSELPLHPAIVHLPIGISFLLPIISAWVFIVYKKTNGSKLILSVITFLHLMLVATTYLAIESGEEQKEKVEKVVEENHIDHHEERAEILLPVSLLALVISIILFFPQIKGWILAVIVLFVLQISILIIAIRIGESGGELVYQHGAASAYEEVLPEKLPTSSPPEEPPDNGN